MAILSDLLIFDHDIKHFMIHIEFNTTKKNIQVNLVRKENIDNEVVRLGMTGSVVIDEDNTFKNRARPLQELMPIEEGLVKQVVNHFTFWLWKRAV